MSSTEHDQPMSTAAIAQLKRLLSQYRQVIKSLEPEQLGSLQQHFAELSDECAMRLVCVSSGVDLPEGRPSSSYGRTEVLLTNEERQMLADLYNSETGL